MNRINKLVITAAASAALLSLGLILCFRNDISQGVSENKLEQYRPITEIQRTNDDSSDDYISESTAETEISSEAITILAENTIATACDTLPKNVMQSLKESAVTIHELYPDSVGWLYIPDTPVSYPVMQGSDNEFYLDHAYDGSRLQAGSVFLDFRCESRLMNPINILYAHNMNSGTMFAGVLRFTEKEYFDSHRYGWIATPDTVYRIDVFSCACADWHDSLYDGSMSVAEWIPHIKERSVVYRALDYADCDRFISLSTCSYEFQNARTILTGKLTEIKED